MLSAFSVGRTTDIQGDSDRQIYERQVTQFFRLYLDCLKLRDRFQTLYFSFLLFLGSLSLVRDAITTSVTMTTSTCTTTAMAVELEKYCCRSFVSLLLRKQLIIIDIKIKSTSVGVVKKHPLALGSRLRTRSTIEGARRRSSYLKKRVRRKIGDE